MSTGAIDLGARPASGPRGRWGGLDAATQGDSGAKVSFVEESHRKMKPVQTEASVLIKIMRHCTEYFPTPVNGLLLGLDVEDAVEITDCFGLQNKADLAAQLMKEKMDAKDIDEKVALEDQRYQRKMLEQLSMVQADCCNVGWYQTMQFRDLKDLEVVEGLCEHQSLSPDAVVIGFDTQLTQLGMGAFKAFRVTDEVLHCKKDFDDGDASAWNRLSGHKVLVEVPLTIRNSLLAQAFLVDWLCKDKALQSAGDFDALQLGDQGGLMEKSLGFISSCLDDLQYEQDKLMRAQKDAARQMQRQRELIQRRRLENDQRRLQNEDSLPEIPQSFRKPELPSQLPTIVMADQLGRVTSRLGGVLEENICRSILLQREAGRQQ